MSGLLQIEGGTFQRDGHIYRTDAGCFIPSLTQIFRLCGLTDYSMIPPAVLQHAQQRGTAVHDLLAAHQRYGEIDEAWLTEETAPRFQAYLQFRRENHFVPDVEWIEKGIIATLFGMPVAMTPDVIGQLNGYDCIVEYKCVDSPQPSWPLQTAAQECGRYRTTRAGRAQRIAVQLKSNGKYHLDSHTRHVYDVARFVAATTTVYTRLDAGQDLLAQLAA